MDDSFSIVVPMESVHRNPGLYEARMSICLEVFSPIAEDCVVRAKTSKHNPRTNLRDEQAMILAILTATIN